MKTCSAAALYATVTPTYRGVVANATDKQLAESVHFIRDWAVDREHTFVSVVAVDDEDQAGEPLSRWEVCRDDRGHDARESYTLSTHASEAEAEAEAARLNAECDAQWLQRHGDGEWAVPAWLAECLDSGTRHLRPGSLAWVQFSLDDEIIGEGVCRYGQGQRETGEDLAAFAAALRNAIAAVEEYFGGTIPEQRPVVA